MKIVFLTDNFETPRTRKRVTEFRNKGYEVDLWGLSYDGDDKLAADLSPNVLGDIHALSYLNRIPYLYKSIKSLLKKYKEESVLYYISGFQLTLFYSLVSKSNFIYEEADIVYGYFKNKAIKGLFHYLDKRLIKKSLLSVLTSEGFLKYHFGENWPKNTIIVPNKINRRVLNLPLLNESRSFNEKNIQFGFIGSIRFESTMFVMEHIVKHHHNHDVHFFGTINDDYKSRIEVLKSYPNFHYRGQFKNPDGLPEVYDQVDFVISTYDAEFDNVKYAEPNKIYETIYFRKPLIASEGTFLGEKIKRLGCGVEVNPLNSDSIDTMIKSFTNENYSQMKDSINKIDRQSAIDNPDLLIDRIENIISNL